MPNESTKQFSVGPPIPHPHRRPFQKVQYIIFLTLLSLTPSAVHASVEYSPVAQTSSYNGILVDDFEIVADWLGCTAESGVVKVGAGACRWTNHPSEPDIVRDFSPTFDASVMDGFQFWAYSAVANDAEFSIVIDSDNVTSNYYYYEVKVDWVGWRYFSIPLEHFDKHGTPVGWDVVGRIRFNTNGWNNTPLASSDLVIDEMRFSPEVVSSILGTPSTPAGSAIWTYTAIATNNTGANRTFDLSLLPESGYLLSATLSTSSIFIPVDASVPFSIEVTLPASFVNSDLGFDPQQFDLHVAADGLVLDAVTVKTIKPLPDHPRLYVSAGQIAALQARYTHTDLSFVRSQLLAQSSATNNGVSTTGKADTTIRRAIEANAFLYLVNADTAAGQLAVQMALDYLDSLAQPHVDIHESRQLYDSVIAGAIVYDWCYPLLTPAQRTTLIAEMKKVAGLAQFGWPVTGKIDYITGHFSEDAPVALLAAGIATMNEDQEFFTRVHDEFRDGLAPSRNLYYPMEKHHQGSNYGVSRFWHEVHSAWLYHHIGLDTLYDAAQGLTPYQTLYARTPSGKFLTEGDNFDPMHIDPRVQLISAQLYADSYMMDEGVRLANGGDYWTLEDATRTFLFWDPTLASTSINGLNTAHYYPSPGGALIARTGWEMDGAGQTSGVAMALMNVGEYYFNNHSHLDSGHFGLYYKGTLALDSGVYEGPSGGYNSYHFRNYHQRTVAHNTLLIADPNEPKMLHYGYAVATRDGGQYRPNGGREWESTQQMLDYGKHAQVLAHEIQPGTLTPEYSYLKGDLTAGYNASASYVYPPKANEIKRSFVFLDLKNSQHPAALVVFDRVTATDASFQKKWLLHSANQPTIIGARVSIERTDSGNNGRLVNDVLLPDVGNQIIQPVGGNGQEFLVDGINPYNSPYNPDVEPGAWRVEVSPASSAATDLFLNVMHVMDANGGPQPLASARVDGNLLVGTQIADRTVLFSRNAAPIIQSATYTIATGPATQKVLITDLQAGVWTVQTASGLQTLTASANGQSIYFSAPSGTHTLYPGHAPTITLSTPAQNSTFIVSDTIDLIASATDAEDGPLSGAITWHSNLDGPLGSGANLSVNGLIAGTHTITASTTDSSGITAIENVSIIIEDAGLGTPQMIAPLTSGSATPTFEWTAVPNATAYTLVIYNVQTDMVELNSDFSATEVGCSAGTNNCTLQPAGVTLAAGDYIWLVRATDGSVVGPWSTYAP